MSSSLSSMNNLKPPSHLHQPLSSQNNYHRSKSPINKTHGINLNQQQQLISNNSNYLKIPQSSTTPNSNMQSLKQQMNNTSHSGSMNLNNISSSNILCTKTSDQSGVSQNISGGGNLNASGKFKKTASIYGVSRDAQSEKLQMQNIQIPKENIQFKQLYSTKDFAVIERIIKKAEKSKKIQKKRCVNGTNSITLSEIIEAYKKVMMKKGIEVLNETHYYALIIKLSLNQHGNTWRQCLEHEKKKNQMKRLSIQHYRYLIVKKYFCKWIENYVQTYRSMQMKSQISHSRQQSPIFVNSERIMMSTIRPQDAQTPISSKSVPFGEITNHTQNFANKTQPNQSQIHSEKQLLFTQPTAQETEFIKNIINLSGQKAIIAQTTQPQSNFNKNFSLTGFSQNLFLTNFGITQSNMQSQDLVIEPSSNQLRSLERSYQKRKKERALGNINKVLVKQLKMTTFNEQNIDFITQKAFQKWALVARTQTHVIKQKEDFINKWMVAFEHYNFKRYATVFQALKNVGIKLRDLEERELKLRCQFENKLINTTFFTWIDKLNRRINYRKQLYKAVNHWSSRLNIKTIQKWKIFMHQQQDVKLRFRNFKMINYIKAFLSLGVPNDIKNQDSNYSDQLQTLIEIRKLKHFNPEEVNQSIYLYEMQIKAAIFDQIKQHYLKMSEYKALQMIRISYKTLVAMKGYTKNQIWLREQEENFQSQQIFKKYKKLLKTWQQYSHQKIILKKRIFCFCQKQQFKLLDKSLHVFKSYYTSKIKSYKMNQVAKQFHSQNLFVKSLVSLEHNRRFTKAQKLQFHENSSKLYSFYLKRTFKGLRDITQHLKLTKAKGYCLDNLIKEQTIKSIFMNWQQTAFQYKRASRQRFVKLTRKTFELLSMGIFAQRYLNDALKRGMKQRKKSLKRKLIVFLREGLLEIKLRHQQRQMNLEIAQVNRVARLYKGFVLYKQEQNVKREQELICEKLHIAKQKQRVFRALNRHSIIQMKIRVMNNLQENQFKKKLFEYLRYSTDKSFALKNAFYDFLVEKSRLKATLMLKFWQSKTIQRTFRRQTLEQRTDYFMKRRYFRNHYRTLEIKNYYDQKLQIFSLYKLKQTQFNVIQGFLMHMNSQEHKNNKKARFHYLSQLIFKSMQTLKRITWLGKAQNFVTQQSKSNKLKTFYNIWQSVYMNSQANGEAIIYLQRRKCQRLLREWQKVIQNEQQKRMMHSLAIFQNENSLRLRLIQLLQYNIKQNNQKRQEFRMKDIKAYWLRLQRVFSRWHQYADFKKQLKQKQNVLQQYQNQKQKQIYFNQIKTQFRSILVIKSLQSQRKEKLQLKYFNLWRDFNFNSKLQNQKKFEIDNYHSAKLAKQYFLRLKGYTNLKKEKNFKNMQCTIYYFRRVLKIFMSTLHHQAYKSNYLRINYQNYVVAKQQKLISNSFKTWKRNFNYSKIDIGSAVYRKRQCFLRFQNQLKAQKLRKIVDQNKELKVIELLVYKLQKRAFQGLKANMQFGGYKRKMEQIQTDYMIRKWFEKWRQAYQNFAQDNYLENNDIDDKSSIVSFKASENKYFEIKKPLNNNRGTAIKRNKENSPTKSTFSIKKQNQTYMSGGGFLGNKLNFINV